MIVYYPRMIGNEWFATNSANGNNVGGPYDTETKAKRRIRDLKRKDTISTIEFDKSGSDDKLVSFSMHTSRIIFEPIMGVYPAIPKKLYRSQWNTKCRTI